MWGKEKFLVQWKGYIAKGDTWESRENLENAKELVEEFEREYGEEVEELRWQEQEEEKKEFSWELPREFTAKLLYGWGRKRYEREREKRWDENWSWWKNSSGQETLKREPCYKSPKREIISHAQTLNPQYQVIQQRQDINSMDHITWRDHVIIEYSRRTCDCELLVYSHL